MLPFDNKILEVVEKYSYPVWLVQQIKKNICPCVDKTTKQPDPNCMKCLGTGHQIKIRKVRAAHQPFRSSERATGIAPNEILYLNSYYTKKNVVADSGDIFVDQGHADVVQDPQYNRSDHSDPVYYHYIASPLKNKPETFIKNFYEILRRAGKA